MISLRSHLRRKVLTYFYANQSARVYVRQLAALLSVDSTNLSRELGRLEREGLLRSDVEGRNRYYCINHSYVYLKPVLTLLQGTVGLVPTLQAMLEGVAGVERAWVYGSFAKGNADSASDIDLLIVGNPDVMELAEEASKLERVLNREINYTVFKPRELTRRLAAGEPVLSDIWNGKRIEVFHR